MSGFSHSLQARGIFHLTVGGTAVSNDYWNTPTKKGQDNGISLHVSCAYLTVARSAAML